MSQVTLEQRLQQRIAAIESHMSREWRLYARYSDYLLICREKLLAEQARLARHARVIAGKTRLKAWQSMRETEDRARRALRVRYIAACLPGVFAWGVPEGATVLE